MLQGTASLRPDAPLHHAKGRASDVFFCSAVSEGITFTAMSAATSRDEAEKNICLMDRLSRYSVIHCYDFPVVICAPPR